MISSLASLAASAALAMAPTPMPAATPRVDSVRTSPSASRDARIRIVDYDPDRVVAIAGAARTATQVQFSDEETILNVAVGDSSAWEVAAEGPVLFIKPRSSAPPTNLLVTTERRGMRRHYSFALTSRTASGRGDAPFVVRFRYPADAVPGAKGALEAALERRILELKLERGVVEGPRNLAYSVQGSGALAPSEVSDNGRFTVLRFPGNQSMPAIYRVGPDGAEALVPFDVRGEFLVVHGVEAQLRLRRGDEVLCLYNEAFDPVGRNPGAGTAAADVERTDRTGDRP
ncbi:MAG: TrbG/VirB9 family P-type conjugative transfer protein [Caulobacter sp.]|nr:TrbG/VirB9 family P-type conjugative transfer protein [Caulobacter sp.]